MATHKAKEQAKDVESLLEKTPLRDKDAHQELQMQLCGLPVQVVAGAAYCAGAGSIPAPYGQASSPLLFDRRQCSSAVLINYVASARLHSLAARCLIGAHRHTVNCYSE